MVHPDGEDDVMSQEQNGRFGYGTSENQLNEWENEKSKFSLQTEREKLKKQFTEFLGEEVVGQVIRVHTSIDDARRALR